MNDRFARDRTFTTTPSMRRLEPIGKNALRPYRFHLQVAESISTIDLSVKLLAREI